MSANSRGGNANDVCQWACFQKQTVVILGKLNMSILRANCGKGKILRDLGELNNFHCMINKPTRITAHSKSFLDVILTNHPDLFKECGTYEPFGTVETFSATLTISMIIGRDLSSMFIMRLLEEKE